MTHCGYPGPYRIGRKLKRTLLGPVPIYDGCPNGDGGQPGHVIALAFNPEVAELLLAALNGEPRPSRPPDDWWRELPCGHPPDPVAWLVWGGWTCHCGRLLDPMDAFPMDGAPGPVVGCDRCGCHVALPVRKST